jgi:CRISPR-associated protein Cas1
VKTLHALPRFGDRWSYLYLEYGTLDRDANGLCFHNDTRRAAVPVDQLAVVMLGPGTSVTHPAVKALAENNCLLCWVGQDGVRLYAHSTGGTFSAARLVHQARLASDPAERLRVAVRMYRKRFADGDLAGRTIDQVRGMEGSRVRKAYQAAAARFGVAWDGRSYDQTDWAAGSPLNRALSAANACLYGVCHAAVVSAGYSAGLGFIHTGKLLSFVYDVADLYKTDVTVPVAFRAAAAGEHDLERRVRLACREGFYEARLMERILPDVAEVLDARDVGGPGDAELEGRAVSLADRGAPWGLSGRADPEGEGRVVGDGGPADR